MILLIFITQIIIMYLLVKGEGKGPFRRGSEYVYTEHVIHGKSLDVILEERDSVHTGLDDFDRGITERVAKFWQQAGN